MPKKRDLTITIMVPALNEEGNLANTIREILSGLRARVSDFEILIFNDGSTDKTGGIANSLAKKNKKIKVIHNNPNRGMGYCYRKGLEMARFEHYMYIPGDNQFPQKALALMLERLGKKDIVIPYVTNMHIRPKTRQWISKAFTNLINLLFGLKVTYYNAPVIHKTRLLKKIALKENSGHAYQAEILVRLLKSGASYTEVGFTMQERKGGSSSAFKLKNIKKVAQTLIFLFWEVYVLKKLI